MTRTRYGLALFFQSFGLVRKNKRLTDIAFEMHLLQDGEQLLGAACWPHAEDIEELSMEYWTIRRLEREQATLREKIAEAEATLNNAQERRFGQLDQSKKGGDELFQSRENLFEEIQTLNNTREEIMLTAQVTKRKHGALKMKAKVLLEEGDESSDKITQCRNSLAELKVEFESTKEHLAQLDREIDSKDAELARLQQMIDDKLKGSKNKAQESFSQISQANKDITKYVAELGMLQEEHSKLCRDIGRFLSLTDNRQDCRSACKSRKSLLAQLRILRASIQWNRRLVDRVTA
ncbi:hypothetical protein V2O64_04200 [Verrucomicrobiaceae bacterium 227]